MSDQLFTVAGTRIFISSLPAVAKGDVAASDFAGTEWVEINGLYNLGELGGEQSVSEFELINEVWTRKTKGGRNGGTMQNQFIPLRLDPGQIKYREAIESCRPYRFKVERGADCTPESAVTISLADPGVVTWDSHGLFAGQPVMFTTTGSLPAGLASGVVYYVVAPTANTFSVSATSGGSAIETTSAGTGVHTASAPPVGMTDLFQGLATDGARSGGAKNDLYTQTWPIAVDGRIVTI